MDRLPLEPIQREAAKNLSQSRMGIYEVLEDAGKFHLLRELVTEKEFKIFICSGYAGKSGDLLFLRLVPPLAGLCDYHVGMTTPYQLIAQSKGDWLQYFDRHDIRPSTVGVDTSEASLLPN